MKGEVTISLSSTDETNALPCLKSENSAPETDDLPDIDGFEVEIYNSAGIRLYRDTYANTVGKLIPLNAGEYRLLAQTGDSTGIGFDAVWYAADEQFTVHGQTVEEISATARMSKVKVAVRYGPGLQAEYAQYHSRVRLDGSASKYLKFEKDETRAAYFPAGNLSYEFYAIVDGEWKYFPADPVECSPNDFITFKVELDTGAGSLNVVTVHLDEQMNVTEQKQVIPAAAAPKDPPVIVLSGFDEGKSYSFVEADGEPLAQADIVAEGGIKSCVLGISSEYLAGRGVPESIDLASAGLDAGIVETLRAAGIRWPREMSGARLANIDFTRSAEVLKYDKDAVPFSGTFTLTVTDGLDRTVTETFSVTNREPGVLSFSPVEGNAFARRFRGLTAGISDGNPEALALQYRTGGDAWTTVCPQSVSEGTAVYGDITGLVPSTEYQVRVIYNGNEDFATEPVTLVTEAAAQVANAGFEDWTTSKFTVSLWFWQSVDIDWYHPWKDADDAWWDVNSRASIPSSSSVNDVMTLKAFPTVTYSTDNKFDGSCSAQIATINVGQTNTSVGITGDSHPGELFIGKADDTGGHDSEGHEFNSRPSEFVFRYQYSPYGSEKFYAEITIKDADGNVIASSVKTDGAGTSSGKWEECRLPLTYRDIPRKAASIYISFKSVYGQDYGVNKWVDLEVGGTVQKVHCGSVLRVDELELVYE